MPHLALQRMLLPGVDVKTMNSGKVKSGLGKDALASGGMDALAIVTVPSGGVASVTFDGIPSGYKNLQIRGVARTDYTQTDSNMDLQFNNDAGSNYSGHYMFGNASGAAAGGGGSTTQINMFRGTGANSTAGRYGCGISDIMDYASSTKNKTVRTFTGHDQNGDATGYVFMFTGAWNNTSPITTIKIIPSNGNIAEGSKFALYGVK